jgi:transcriptional regulator of acetoin/glycerol metabolism
MPPDGETRDDSQRMPGLALPPEPGVVVLFAAGRPASVALAADATGLEIGRGTPSGVLDDDDRVSRRHVRIRWLEGSETTGWHIEDLASRNGTIVDGRPLEHPQSFASPALVRIGRSLLWAVGDIRPYRGDATPWVADGPVVGGVLRRSFGEIALAARAGDTLCILGESGAGKELAARAFHQARHGEVAGAPFVAVNCAAIPEGLAERLLFGARKGSYSGATADADGFIQTAQGGTLFLDEIAELDPLVQAKLLRVLETREVVALGSSRPKKVEFDVCAASHRSLREEVAARRFREDLYFRIGRPEVTVPPLRERIDEIPWLVARALHGVHERLSVSVAFVEACALRPWPGNVRELLREVRRAAHAALEAGADVVEAERLPADAGVRLLFANHAPTADAGPEPRPVTPLPGEEDIRRALETHAGNVRATARALGIHRNQLRRWLEKQRNG